MTIHHPSRREILAAGAAAAGVAAVPFIASAQAPIVHQVQPRRRRDTPKGKARRYFKELAEERPRAASRSRSTRTATLYKDKEEMEALQLGAVQMLAPSLAKFGPLGVKEFEVFDLPLHLRQLRRNCTR